MGDVNVHVNLRHMHILCYVTGLVLYELQDEKSYGGHRSSLERPCSNVSWKKKTRRVFRNKFPVIYRLSFKTHFKISGNFEPILGHESVVSLWRKRHFFLKPSKRWRPAGCISYACYAHFFGPRSASLQWLRFTRMFPETWDQPEPGSGRGE